MTQESKPLCEAICEDMTAQFVSHAEKAKPDSVLEELIRLSGVIALLIVAQHFAALSVEDVARAISGYEPLMWKHMSQLQKEPYLKQAQAAMKLLRKE